MGTLFNMPGANCSLYGCGTSRKHKAIGIFKLPLPKDEFHKKWREDLLDVILRYRLLDDNLERQINENRIHICQRHFTDDQLYVYPSRKLLKEGALPTLNLLPPPAQISKRPGPKHCRRKLRTDEASSMSERLQGSPPSLERVPTFRRYSLRTDQENEDNSKSTASDGPGSAFRPYKPPKKHFKKPRLDSEQFANVQALISSKKERQIKSRKARLEKSSSTNCTVCFTKNSPKQSALQTKTIDYETGTSEVSEIINNKLRFEDCFKSECPLNAKLKMKVDDQASNAGKVRVKTTIVFPQKVKKEEIPTANVVVTSTSNLITTLTETATETCCYIRWPSTSNLDVESSSLKRLSITAVPTLESRKMQFEPARDKSVERNMESNNYCYPMSPVFLPWD